MLEAAAAAALAPSALTVEEATAGESTHVQYALGKWVRACGIAGDPGSVRVVELLPRYAELLMTCSSSIFAGQTPPPGCGMHASVAHKLLALVGT